MVDLKDIKSPGGFDSIDSGRAAAEIKLDWGTGTVPLEKTSTEHFEEINDSWWERLEDKIAKRTWLENAYWWCKHHVRDTYNWFKYTPYYIYQYFKYGFSCRQLWSLDVTIAKFTIPRLKRLKEIKHGHPMIEANEQLCLRCWTYPEMWNLDKCYWNPNAFFHFDSGEIWDEYMDKMIFAMESLAKNKDWDPPMPDDLHSIDIRKGNAKWIAYCKDRDEHWIKMKEGIKLFGEYFAALGD